jgi:hypothetical protein
MRPAPTPTEPVATAEAAGFHLAEAIAFERESAWPLAARSYLRAALLYDWLGWADEAQACTDDAREAEAFASERAA